MKVSKIHFLAIAESLGFKANSLNDLTNEQKIKVISFFKPEEAVSSLSFKTTVSGIEVIFNGDIDKLYAKSISDEIAHAVLSKTKNTNLKPIKSITIEF